MGNIKSSLGLSNNEENHLNLKITKDQIEQDINRFSKLHSWYKHLSDVGYEFIVIFKQGEQPRHEVCPQVNDTDGLHCWFLRKELYKNTKDIPLVCYNNPVKFNYKFGSSQQGTQINDALNIILYLAKELSLLEA